MIVCQRDSAARLPLASRIRPVRLLCLVLPLTLAGVAVGDTGLLPSSLLGRALLGSDEKAFTGNPSPSPLQTFAGIMPANSLPPDSHGAVGPSHVMTQINGQSVIRDRNGNLLSSVSLVGFWSSLGVSDVFDPKVLYDPYSGRFIAVACAQRRSSSSGMLFGISASSDPTGSWHLWLLDADPSNQNWVDYPSIGLTSTRITVSGNLFSVSGDSFGGVNFWTIDTASAADGGGLTLQLLKITNAGGTLVPAFTHDVSETTQYIVRTGTSNLFGTGRLQMYSITGSIGSLSFNQIPSASIGTAWSISLPNAKQLGSSATIETNDDRLQNAVVRGGRLWTAHTVGFDTVTRDHTAVKWWEIVPGTGAVVQSGLIEDVDVSGNFNNSTGRYYYFPSVAVNANNDVLIGFTGSGGLEYASCYYALRPSTAGTGLFNTPVKYRDGSGTFSGPRWGDYSHTVVDPVDDTTFWTVQQFAQGGNQSANFWAKVGQGGGSGDTTNPRVSSATALTGTTVRITYDETMQNNAALVNAANYTFNGGLTAASVVRLNTTQVSVTVNEMINGQGYTASVSTSGPTDAAGNPVSPSGNTATFTGIGTPPTAAIGLDNPSPTNLNTVNFSVDFSESVGTSFTSGDVTVTGSLASGSGVAVSGGPLDFTVGVTPSNPNGEGTIGISVGTGIFDVVGNPFAGGSSPSSYTVDNTAPAVGVNMLLTTDSTPPLTGTINDNGASISIAVAGQTRTATNNGNGTWTLANNALSTIADGTYNVVATATDAAGNSAVDATNNELTIDATAPTITVNSRLTNDNTPQLSGTVNEPGAAITIVVGGQTRSATNNGNGTWTLPDGSLNPLSDGVYNVAATAADAVGNMGTDSSANELTVDTAAPVLTVTPRVTNDTRPPLSGTTSDPSAAISLSVGSQTRSATNNGDGTWSLADNAINPALPAGTYNVAVTSTDAAGNAGADATSNELTIDVTPPTVAVNNLTTNDGNPQITGTINDMGATLTLTVGGRSGTPVNNGNGTWTLPNNSFSLLPEGTYNVVVTATDAAGNNGTDGTTNELTIDTTAPAVTVNNLVTSDTTPPLNGTVNDANATISVTVNGQVRAAVNNGTTWSLADGSLSALPQGTYNVAVRATDTAGNAGNDSTNNELTVDTTAPTITVNALSTSDSTPPLTGTVSEPGATVRVSVGAQVNLLATNNGNGTWTLPNNTLTTLADGIYNVIATATDGAANSGSDSTSNELTIDTTAPIVTVNSLTTNDNRPPLTGTVNDTAASISISVGGQTRSATNNGNGTWTLADNAINPGLASNTYNVTVTATDSAGNAGTDGTTNELVVDTVAPSVTVATRTTNDTTPPLNGTINDNNATISISVGGQTRSATNNGNGTWTLPDGSLSALSAGTYNVSVTAADTAGNVGADGTSNELVIDLTAPVIAVNSSTTNDNTPPLSGTINDNGASISITVGGQTRTATNNGNGTWTLANNSLSTLSDGVYNVMASATDTAGNTGSDASNNELRVDTIAPTVTVNTLATSDTTPPLSGTVSETGASISVSVGGQTRSATNNGNGTWTLANNALTTLANGTYNVAVTATDAAGNAGVDATTNELVIDNAAPTVTVNSLTTNDQRPQLTGTVNDTAAVVRVTVGPQSNLLANNNGNGTWTLADNTITPNLAPGTYNVSVSATDAVGNVGNDGTTNELMIDTTAPSVTVNTLTTNDTRPPLSGTVNDNGAPITVAVGGQTRTATNNGNGTWTLADNAINPALSQGVYNVSVTATDTAGNSASDATSNELRIDTTAPSVTIDTLVTNDTRPPLSGTTNDTTASIRVDVGGQTNLAATNNGNGTWTLADNAINPALSNGTFNVVARATDTAGNVGTDGSSAELTVDTIAPTVTVTALQTADNRPALNGTVNETGAAISITVSGQTNAATNNGNGTWTLADNTLTALPDNTYSVLATATDAAGNVGTDGTANELTVDTTGPVLTVNALTTNSARPALTGTINDTAASVTVNVGGQNGLAATNNGNGTWTLPANTINPGLADGTYTVVANGTDSLGNTGMVSATNSLTVDTTLTVTVNSLTTSDTTPALSGTIDDTTATLSVTVNGNTYAGTNNGNGTWTLADNTISPALTNGTYNVSVSATDGLGNSASDATNNELTIDASAPTVGVNSTATSDNRPALTGTVSAPGASIAVDVGGQTGLAAINNGNGTWTLPDNTINPALPDGTYDVVVRATLGGTGTDSTANELIIDTAAPITTVDSLTTNDQRPPLSGTINEPGASITIDVGGQTGLVAANNGDGTWTLADNLINPALAANTYTVTVNASDAAGNVDNNAVAGALVVDLTAPTITVTSLTTGDTTPAIVGTVNDNSATVRVDVGAQTNLTAINNGDGSWILPDNTVSPLGGGTFQVVARATDAAGNIGTDATSNELTVDVTAPTITVNALSTTDNTPALSGTVNDAAASISIMVGGQTHAATNNGATWTLPNNTISTLADGVYNVVATATDPQGNAGTDPTANELRIDTTAPVVTVNTLTTSDNRPALTGTVNDIAATILVSVGGQNNLAATNNGDGTWTLADNTINPALADNTYNVVATAMDSLGNSASDATTNELRILSTPPTITVNALTTNDTRPPLTGTVNDTTATIVVRVNETNFNATNNGNGTWTLADNAITPALTEGVYSVGARATNAAGLFGFDPTNNELTIDVTPPAVAVNTLFTSDTRPPLTGTTNSSTATIRIDVGGQTNLAAVNNGNGTWTLADNTINPALSQGNYNVVARATDAAGNVGTESTTNELRIDTTPPTVTVAALSTSDNTPALTGSVSDNFAGTITVSVVVNGQNRTATVNAGTWTVANGALTTLPDGTYNVQVTATDATGNVGNDATTNELRVDTAAPTVTVNALSTNDNRPPLTGNVNDNAATVRVTVGSQTNVPATNNGNGTWTLVDNTLTTLADGTYNVQVTATDTVGNVGADGTSDELTIDATAPVITVNTLVTNDSTPPLTGTINDTSATVAVTVSGNTFAATNNGNGTWTLANNSIAPALAAGTYDVTARATDSAGNIGTDLTASELTVDLTAPTITVTSFQTNDDTPPLSGTVNDNVATIRVSVGGQTNVPATNNGNGTWTLPDGVLSSLPDGVYNVTAQATDAAGNTGADGTTNELTINSQAPTVTVDTLATNDTTPPLSGTVDDPNAVLTIAVGGQTGLAATNNGDGTWELPDGALSALADGVYNVVVEARDAQNNVGMDGTASELTIDTVAPVVTVNPLLSNDNRPALSGTINDPTATIAVAVNGETGLMAVNNGDGTWTLPDNTIAGPLPDNATGYDVTATATDAIGNSASDTTTDELRIDTTAPVVAVNMVTTNVASPQLTGMVNDDFAQISVTVNGQTVSATNNSNGTWTLPSGTLTPLATGTYTVEASATDLAGNTGNASLPNGLVVDVTPPVIAVNTLVTTDTTPMLTGTVDDINAVVLIRVADQSNTATNNGNGTWTLADNTLTMLVDGVYDVVATATDALGNVGTESGSNELTIDTSGPAVTVNNLITNDTTPPLTGTISEPGVVIEVTVEGNNYNAANNGDGTWALADDTITPALTPGTYDVMVVATDGLGNMGADSSTDELIVDLTAPVVTVDSSLTTLASPNLTGTVDDIFATVTIQVGGQTRTATTIGNGTWALVAGSLDPLSSGVYDIVATATDLAGNASSDATSDELTIDLDAPAITVDQLVTNDNTPPLSGAVDDPAATITVTVAGQTLSAVNNGDGTWAIADNMLSTLLDGAYNVLAEARDTAGNVGVDPTTVDDLFIVTVAPEVAVLPLTTSDTTPRLNGFVNQATSTVTIQVDGQTHLANNNGNGTWTLPDNTLSALPEGTYDVRAEATDLLGNTGIDTTSDELVINLSAPIITVNSLSTRDRTPPLAGTVSVPGIPIVIMVGGQTHNAVNNGDGTWVLADDTLSTLEDGVYDVVAVAQGAVDGTDSTVNELAIDTLGPTLVIGGPSVLSTQSGPISFNLHYGEGAQVGLLTSDVGTFSLLEPNVTVLGKGEGNAPKTFPISTATAEGVVTISGSGNQVRTVTVSEITGDGYLGIAIIGGSAVDAAGNPAPSANSVELAYVDNTAPKIIAGGVANLGILTVTFDEPMNDTALNPANYAISGPGRGTLSVNPDLVIRMSPSRYRLIWSVGASINGEEITISVLNVADAVTNLIEEDNTVTVLVEGIGVAPAVTGVEVLGARSVAVRFSEPIDMGALIADSYTVSGTGSGTLAPMPSSVSELPAVDPEDPDNLFPEDRNGYRLTWDSGEMRQGGDITITVAGVEDNSGDTIGSPASGTDSGGGIGTAPTVQEVNVITGLTVETVFTEGMGAGALDPANYTISSAGRGSLADNPDTVSLTATGRYLLTWNSGEMLNGRDVTITAANVTDLAGNELGTPDSATDANAGRDGLITARIPARRDATLFEDAEGDLANGAGASVFAGLGQDDLVRRGLLFFDVVGNIPPGSNVMDALLILDSAGTGSVPAQDVSLLRVTGDWTEGASTGGIDGAPAQENDATWIHSSFDTATWLAPGGDFAAGARATARVAGAGEYQWNSGEMQADAQSWLDDPDNNFGWLLMGNEDDAGGVKDFFSNDHGVAGQRPMLEIIYSLNGGPGGPVLGSIGDQAIDEGETITLDLTAVDTSNNPVAITSALASLPEGHDAILTDNSDGTAQFNWTPTFTDSGAYVVTFIATQLGVADPLSVSETIVIDVAEINQTPSFADPGEQAATEGELFTFEPALTDNDAGDDHDFSLVSPVGNAAVDETTGQLTWTPGFSSAGTVTIRILAVDNGVPPATAMLELQVEVADANGPPAIAPIGDQIVVEGDNLSFLVMASDPDLADALTFSLDTPPTGATIDPDTGMFSWTPSIIAASEYAVTFVVTDDGEPPMSAMQTVQVTVLDNNQDPANIRLTPASIPENLPVGTPVGTLTTEDPDAGDIHTYTLVSGTGDADNGQFSIDGNTLVANVTLNFEAKSSYSVRVQSFDGKDGTFARALTVTVSNRNDPPQSIGLSNASVTENVPVGTAVGTLTTQDEDAANLHTYTLVDGDGSVDNSRFNIDGNALVTAGTIDFETNTTLSVRVRSTDPADASIEAVFVIAVNNVNDTPNSVSLSSSQIAENAPAGTLVGEFMTEDADSGDSHVYTLVAGSGSTDNPSFQIQDNRLLVAQPLDFERGRLRSIRVRTNDGQSLNFEMIFQIEVLDRNDAPTNIILNAAGILGSVPASTKIADLNSADQDLGDSHTYSLVAGEGSQDNGRFAITGRALSTAQPVDFESQAAFNLRLRTTDAAGASFEKAFVLVNDDTDGDGLSDTWEMANFGNLTPLPNEDIDGDGLTNLDEFLRRTNPRNADSDGDGIMDGLEISLGTDPNNSGDTPPSLRVTPSSLSLGREAGALTLNVQNTGAATLTWQAEVTSGGSFATIESGATGTNTGQIRVAVDANGGAASRLATIRVSAPNAAGSPVEIPLSQSACAVPGIPEDVLATNGTLPGQVRITWDAVPGADRYMVYRGLELDPASASLVATVTGTAYTDSDAPSLDAAKQDDGMGCILLPGPLPDADTYQYFVRATSVCGTSAFSAPNDGFPGAGQPPARQFFEPVLPSMETENRTLTARAGSVLAIRLRRDTAINPATIAGMVEFAGGSSTAVEWLAIDASGLTDGWALYQPADGEFVEGDTVTFTVSASTVSGESIGPLSYAFTIESEEAFLDRVGASIDPVFQPDYSDFDASGLDLTQESNDMSALYALTDGALPSAPVGSVGPAYAIVPDETFGLRQRVWIPLPNDLSAEDVAVNYYFTDKTGNQTGWYSSQSIRGWAVQDSFVELDVDGVRYIGFLVRHGGRVQLSVAGAKAEASAGASVIPLSGVVKTFGGDAVLLLLLLFGLAIAVPKYRRNAED